MATTKTTRKDADTSPSEGGESNVEETVEETKNDSDASAEAAMNEKTSQDSKDATEDEPEATNEDDGAIALPENQFRTLKEILKHPADAEKFGENAFQIPKNAARLVFEDMKSAKTLLQSAKTQLIKNKILEVKQPGGQGQGQEMVVALLTDNYKLRVGGQGRRSSRGAGKPQEASAGKPRRGRPPNPTPEREASKSRAKTSSIGSPNGYITVDMIREKVAQNPERIEKFLTDIGKVAERYPDLFNAHFQLK